MAEMPQSGFYSKKNGEFMKKFFASFFFILFSVFSVSAQAIWSSELDWSRNILVDSAKFNSVSGGTKIDFNVTKTRNEYQNIKIYDGNWKELTGGSYSNAKYTGAIVPNFSSQTVTFSYVLTADNAASIKRSGMIIHGYGMRLNEISVGGKSVSSISATSSSSSSSSAAGNSSSSSSSSATAKSTPATVSGTPFSNHGKLSVKGAYLVDSKNQKYMLYGFSTHGLNFGNDFSKFVSQETFKTIRDDFNTNCIRLVLYPRDYGGYCNGGNKQQLKQFIENGIEYATKLGMYAIVDWHVHNYNPVETQGEAVSFLSEIAAKYKNYGNVLYEICNEPTGSPWASAIKPYAEKVIPAIRQHAPDAVVIVGTNTWSQDIEEPLSNPLSFKNVMYTFHFYASTHRDSFRNRVESAVNKGLPIFITEFGTCDSSGNGGFNSSESEKWFSLCEKYNISHMNWSLSNKGETASAIQSWCQKTSGWTDSDLTESGKLVKKHFKNLKRQ
jgi:endoglucanase